MVPMDSDEMTGEASGEPAPHGTESCSSCSSDSEESWVGYMQMGWGGGDIIADRVRIPILQHGCEGHKTTTQEAKIQEKRNLGKRPLTTVKGTGNRTRLRLSARVRPTLKRKKSPESGLRYLCSISYLQMLESSNLALWRTRNC